MSQDLLATETNRRQLQQIISGLSDGVILLEADRRIVWANEAALAMHGVEAIGELGADDRQYAERFALRYRNNHPLALESYPINRVAAGRPSAMWWWRCAAARVRRSGPGCIGCAA